MKIKEMPYRRMDMEEAVARGEKIVAAVKGATCASEVLAAREDKLVLDDEVRTAFELAFIRFTQDSRDEFYQKEKDYYDETRPAYELVDKQFADAMLASPFRSELEAALSPLVFRSMENAARCVHEEILGDMQEENALVTDYSKLMSRMTFFFRGAEMPLTLLKKHMSADDRAERREAYEALGRRLSESRGDLDGIFDKLVKVRHRMAKKLGFENFIPLGYLRMNRLCYDEAKIEVFRGNVLSSFVPAAARLKNALAADMGWGKVMLYDNDINARGGNPRPAASKEEIFARAREMYHDMGGETGAFIESMLAADAFDVDSREGKWGGGYCTYIPLYRQPFILANFNGTSGDVDVITHEAGHALAFYLTADNRLKELEQGGMETAETHSMSMEFFAWKYMEGFFGAAADKYKRMHLTEAVCFVPYGTMVDAFQHIVYARPDLTPAERNAAWKELEKKFRPYLSAEGIPYLEEGTRWQYQMHIYESPFYYIDYCLAQSVAIQFLLASQEDYTGAFERYLAFVRTGGAEAFDTLVSRAGLRSPFAPGALTEVATGAEALLTRLRAKGK